MCQSADELQLVGVSEFPQTVVENSHVSAQGKLFARPPCTITPAFS